jgi:hypothetical protein
MTTLANQIQSGAAAWQIYAIARRPPALGYVGLAQFLPIAALFFVAGDIADRHNDRGLVWDRAFGRYRRGRHRPGGHALDAALSWPAQSRQIIRFASRRSADGGLGRSLERPGFRDLREDRFMELVAKWMVGGRACSIQGNI